MKKSEVGSTVWEAKTAVFCFLLLTAYSLLFTTGCSSDKHATTQPASAYDRQNAALRDPFGYSPNMGTNDDISGGDIGHYDRKAMRKDINDVLNP